MARNYTDENAFQGTKSVKSVQSVVQVSSCFEDVNNVPFIFELKSTLGQGKSLF